MKSQQIVDYITKQIQAGHSEATLRAHLQKHGWSASAVDKAFAAYKLQTKKARKRKRHLVPAKALRRGQRPTKRSKKLTLLLRLAVLLPLLVIGYVAYQLFWPGAQDTPPKPVVRQLTYQERQSIDINTVAGAIAQYTEANGGVLPTRLSVGGDTSLIMCTNTCDPTTSQVASLTVYNAANVKIMNYSPTLSVPDINTMYLVAQAKCASHSAIGGANTNPRSMILLYMRTDTKPPQQRCTIL